VRTVRALLVNHSRHLDALQTKTMSNAHHVRTVWCHVRTVRPHARTIRRHNRTVCIKLYLTSDDAFNAMITVIIDRCDLAIDLAGVDHLDQERETTRRWLLSINTTLTTPFKGTQASTTHIHCKEKIRHSICTQSIKVLSKFHNCV
jgi:hypothetical protein